MSQEPKKLADAKIDSRREVIVPISLKGLYDGYERITYRAPKDAFQWVARQADNLSNTMTTGVAAALTMPAGIILRNSARAMHEASDGKYLQIAHVGGVAGALGGWWVAGSAALATLTTTFGVASTVGSVGATIAAAVVSSVVIVPAFTVGLLGASLALGGIVAAVSTVPAVVNLPVALRRSVDAIKGIKLDRKELDAVFEKNSLETRDQNRRFTQASSAIYRLNDDNKRKLYEDLKASFEDAAAHAPRGNKQRPVVIVDDVTPAVSAAKPNTPKA